MFLQREKNYTILMRQVGKESQSCKQTILTRGIKIFNQICLCCYKCQYPKQNKYVKSISKSRPAADNVSFVKPFLNFYQIFDKVISD